MKSISVIIFLIFPVLIFSQNFKILEINIEELKSEMKRINYSEDIVYVYLSRNYDSIAKKREIIYYDNSDYSICSFNQGFENEINYSLEQCEESGGASISLVFPKTARQSLVKWIEMIFECSPMDIEHSWNSDKTKFEPTDKGVGCYFEIKESENYTLVENYCGC